MDKKEIAYRLACLCYEPKDDYDTNYAVQLFVEDVVLPDKMKRYDVREMERYILEYYEKVIGA